MTADSCEVITKFPTEQLLVAGQRYFAVGGTLAEARESQSHMNSRWRGTPRRATPRGVSSHDAPASRRA